MSKVRWQCPNHQACAPDYHLEYGNVSFLGTDLMRSLLDRGYHGLICIRSANTTSCDEATYIEAGARRAFLIPTDRKLQGALPGA